MFKILSLLLILIGFSCSNNDAPSTTDSSDGTFTIVANDQGILKKYDRMIDVFGIKIFAVPKVSDKKLFHTANVLAQYLDNDEDGIVDNPEVVQTMIDNKACMVLWNKKIDLLKRPKGWTAQDLGNDETIPDYVRTGKNGRFDATLEEVLHIITHAGYAKTYPTIFGENSTSEIAKAMDIARGGKHTDIPSSYPATAWYSYTDKTCDYSCQVTEYHYWALTSLLRGQENRLDEISHEWKLNTPEKVKEQDKAVYALLTDEKYKFPTVLPDGNYRK